jgi:hypothetical protein
MRKSLKEMLCFVSEKNLRVVTSGQLTSFGAGRGRVQCRLHLGLRVESWVSVLRKGDNNGFAKAQDSENYHCFWRLASGLRAQTWSSMPFRQTASVKPKRPWP